MTKDITINSEQKLYVIPEGEGVSTLGFDVAERRTEDLRDWLCEQGEIHVPQIDYNLKGTVDGYRQYRDFQGRALDLRRDLGGIIPIELTPQLVGLEGEKVKVVDVHGETKKFLVSRSMGLIPIHLEVHEDDDDYDGIGGFPVTGAPYQSVTVLD